MKKLNKFFITALVAGLVALSAALAMPTQMAQALIKTEQIENNAITSPKIKDGEVKTPDLATAAVTKPKLDPNAVKLVVIDRHTFVNIEPNSDASATPNCNPDEIVTGGGFFVSPAPDSLFVAENRQLDNGWRVSVINTGDVVKAFESHVMCAHLELGP